MPQPESDKTSKERIYAEIRRSIMIGTCLPGERLSADKLANEYGTSITPVRDALQMLSEAGLVTIKPRSGYFVAVMTAKQLWDLLELREILELAAIERANSQISDQQIAALEGIQCSVPGNVAKSHPCAIECDRQFHYVMVQASGNHEIADTLARVHDRLARFFVMSGACDVLHSTHASLIAALQRRDSAAAQQALASELAQTRSVIVEHLGQIETDAWFSAS